VQLRGARDAEVAQRRADRFRENFALVMTAMVHIMGSRRDLLQDVERMTEDVIIALSEQEAQSPPFLTQEQDYENPAFLFADETIASQSDVSADIPPCDCGQKHE